MGCSVSRERKFVVNKLETLECVAHDDEYYENSPSGGNIFAKYTYFNRQDYCNDLIFLSEGGNGRVYSSYCKSKCKRFALKFFGYHDRQTDVADVLNEIDKFQELIDVDGVVQYEGIILDTPDGIVPNKVHKIPYPVIVMELLAGGELFQKIHHRDAVSEYDIARMFRDIVIAVDNIHSHGYIHRDLKLENIMFVFDDDESPIKLIDFDNMVKIPSGHDSIYRGYVINGSVCNIAPESLLYFDYSTASDVWQLGCILYSMLSGLPPFDPGDFGQVTQESFHSMSGVGWDSISEPAKNLVRTLLNRNPKYRLPIDRLLEHPWMNGEAPELTLGELYMQRVRNLSLRQQLRAFFMDTTLRNGYAERKDKLRAVLPLLLWSDSMSVMSVGMEYGDDEGQIDRPGRSTSIGLSKLESVLEHGKNDYDSTIRYEDEFSHSCSSFDFARNADVSSGLSFIRPSEHAPSADSGADSPLPRYHRVLKHYRSMKIMLLNVAKPQSQRHNLDYADTMSSCGSVSSFQIQQRSTNDSRKLVPPDGYMSYDDFSPVYTRLELPPHSFEKVCSLFDSERTGFINMKDFLITMISLRREALSTLNTPAKSSHGMMSRTCIVESPVVSPTKALLGLPEQVATPSLPSASLELSPGPPVVKSARTCSPMERMLPLNLSPAKDRMSPVHSTRSTDDIIRLYFDIFDVDEDGFIQMDDMKLVTRNLLLDSPDSRCVSKDAALSPHVKDLFSVMDQDGDRMIDYDEFNLFLKSLLHRPSLKRM